MIVWVMSEAQINDRSRVFIDELGLAERILFLSDPKSQLIRDLGILKENPEAIEKGVPHPTTLLLDRSGIVQFVDVRENYHFWLDPAALSDVLARLE
jgi:peroxiredoxin